MIEDMIRDEKLQYQVLRHRGGWGVGADGAIGGGAGGGGGAPDGAITPPALTFSPSNFFLHGKLKEEK